MNNPASYLDPWGLIYIKDKSVKISDLNVEIKDTWPIIDEVSQKYRGDDATITSANDSKHMEGSKHYTNDAIDIRGNDISVKEMKKIADDIKQKLGPDYDVVPEVYINTPSNNHIHIEYNPKKPKRQQESQPSAPCKGGRKC